MPVPGYRDLAEGVPTTWPCSRESFTNMTRRLEPPRSRLKYSPCSCLASGHTQHVNVSDSLRCRAELPRNLSQAAGASCGSCAGRCCSVKSHVQTIQSSRAPIWQYVDAGRKHRQGAAIFHR